MPSREKDRNCVGFVLFHYGLIEKERYVEPRTVEPILLRYFARTDFSNADTLAIRIAMSGTLVHMALLSPEKEMVTQRFGSGKVSTEPLTGMLRKYGLGGEESPFKTSYLKFLGREAG